MNPNRFRYLVAALHALACLALASPAGAQTGPWPNRPIRLVVPFPPGGPADINARLIAPRLGERLGQPVVVENRPGAQSNIGYEAVAKAPPDGYTMVLAIAGLVTNPHLYKLAYDPMKDLIPVAQIVSIQLVMVASARFAPNTVAEVLAAARAQPGKVTCAWGASTVLQIACESLRLDGRAEITTVPYKGLAPAMNDLIGGQVDILFDSVSTAAPQVRGGRVKAIATTNTRRGLQPFPDLPTVGETIPGFEITTWNGILMPAGTPRDIVLRMNQEIGAVLAIPEVRQRIVESGLDVLHGTPEEFGAVLQRDYERYGRVIRAANIRAD